MLLLLVDYLLEQLGGDAVPVVPTDL